MLGQRLILCSLVWLVPVPTEHASGQTSIVAVRTPTEVVIGADSKAIKQVSRISWSTCKIVQYGTLFFASARMAEYRPTGFDIKTIARRAFKARGGVSEKSKAFEMAVVPELKRAVASLKKHLPKIYEKDYKTTVLEALYVGMEHGSPVLVTTRFQPIILSSGKVSVIPHRWLCPGDCVPEWGISYVFMGEHRAIDKLMKDKPDFFAIGLEKAVVRLIKVEISEDPEWVGPPIDVLRVDTTGAKWLMKKKQCPDVMP